MATTEVQIIPGEVEPYGEWGCHSCSPSLAGARDLLPASAERKAREHLQTTGHDVFVVSGTAQALRAAGES